MSAFAALSLTAAQKPKFVVFGWEFNTSSPQELLKLADEFDKTPIDGIGIKLKADTVVDGKKTTFFYRHFMHQPSWTKEAFADQIPLFRKLTAHRSMKHCFVNSFAAPRKRIPWTDDAEWARLAKSMRTVAWVARQGGMKGLTIDPEDYSKAHQFTRMPDDPPYGELCATVRRRARELFAPVFEEYPDVTLHFFWFMSHVQYYAKRDRADIVKMAKVDESLWPSFVNGILDILPPEARVNDGQEDSYHSSAAKLGYRNDAYMFHALYPKLVDPANLEKYRRQVGYAPAVYMEMFLNKEGSTWYKGPTNGSRVETLRADLVQATDVCGGYVWFWGEKHTWLNRGKNWYKPDHRIKDTTWAQELPGLFRAMAWAKDPVALYDSEVAALKQKGEPKNCVETTSVTVTNGYKTVSLKNVKGGEWYAIGYDAKGASAKMNIFFKDAKRKYVQPSINLIYPDDGRGVVRVPDGGANGTLVFSAKNRPGEKTVFDSIHAYRIASEETEKKVSEEKEAVK
jgi:hypothetical protein